MNETQKQALLQVGGIVLAGLVVLALAISAVQWLGEQVGIGGDDDRQATGEATPPPPAGPTSTAPDPPQVSGASSETGQAATDTAAARRFTRYARENFGDGTSARFIRRAEIVGAVPTLRAYIDVGEDADVVAPAEAVCGFINAWLIDTEGADAERGEVAGSQGVVVARCRPGEPTEVDVP